MPYPVHTALTTAVAATAAADTLQDLHPAPPFGILEPSRNHPDGSPRLEGTLLVASTHAINFDGGSIWFSAGSQVAAAGELTCSVLWVASVTVVQLQV